MVKMEFNFPITNKESPKDLANHIESIQLAGWSGLVLNYQISEYDVKDFKIPVKVDLNLPSNLIQTSQLQLKKTSHSEFSIYHRLTVVIKKGETLAKLLDNPRLDFFDIIAVIPEKVEHLGLITQKLNVDVVVLPEKMLNSTIINKIHEIIRRNIQLEVCYGDALTNQKEFLSFVSLMSAMTRFTKGKNIILSNGTRNTIKSPQDIANLACFLGYEHSLGTRMINQHVRDALMHGEQRRTIRGAIKIIQH